ncbi:hypothetical protein K1T71_014692 [Dendrolimus kikuchii]|uniref:Uncharacterized protein n=1 Tax=Dendrolimus kikuchii TaxID=765133 RepID=A0ACC1CET5_9NEOP|nr:hypothetical protein K1T71_014692 [Dendrolimus kikuchii]
MARVCCVCGSADVYNNKDIIFFDFPISAYLRRKWKDAIQLTGRITHDSLVCSEHFEKSQYKTVRGKPRLIGRVVPSLYLNNKNNVTSEKKTNSGENSIDNVIENSSAEKTEENISNLDTEINIDLVPSLTCKEKRIDVPEENTSRSSPKDDVGTETLTNNIPEETLSGVSENLYFVYSTPIPSQPDPKEDIEDILTNYHIQNKGQLVMESDRVEDRQPEIQTVTEKEPVFIEISVGKIPNDVPESQDCLMVLESVQVDVDPSSFLLPEQEYDIAGDDDDDDDDDDVQITENKKADPISLLTSSDESDVILEEPNIDTVEVSDETDEDDVPLVRLVPKSDKSDKNSEIAKIMWGLYEYYCIQCKFYSTSKSDYVQHVKEHEKVLQMCQICGYTTASKHQFDRHRRKHKDERRFKCHLCDYKARHNMSLMYHLKTHDTQNGGKRHKPGYSCHCGFRTNDKTTMLKHVRACKVDERPKKYSCKSCSYSSNRRGDLKRHVLRKHKTISDDDDDDYLP